MYAHMYMHNCNSYMIHVHVYCYNSTLGSMDWPYPWSPKIVPLQILSVGQLVIVAVPGEFTTMSGRLMKKAILKVIHYRTVSVCMKFITIQQ